MSEDKRADAETVSKLKQWRDELAVQMHLGSQEAKDEWEKLEGKWKELEVGGKKVGDVVAESKEGVDAALDVVAEELKSGYEKLRSLLS